MKDSLFYKVGRVPCRLYTTIMHDFKAYGAELVPDSGGVLIVSNHQSYIDPVLLGTAIKNRPLSYLAKSELFENRYFGFMIRNMNAFPVRQGAGDVGAVKETIRRLQEGHALNVFPEGSRTPDGELQPMQSGIGLIVRRAGVPVVPAAIVGSYEAFPRHAKFPRRRPVRLQFGPPMHLADLKAAEIVKRIGDTIRELFEDLRRRESEARYAG